MPKHTPEGVNGSNAAPELKVRYLGQPGRSGALGGIHDPVTIVAEKEKRTEDITFRAAYDYAKESGIQGYDERKKYHFTLVGNYSALR